MTIRIESDDNQRLKAIRKLALKKHRDASSSFVIEGVNLITEALNRKADIDYLVASDDFDAGNIFAVCDLKDIPTFTVSRESFEKLTDAGNGVGVLAVVRKPSYDKLIERIDSYDNILVLDKVQDPGNIGTMIRTAVAAGYAMVVMTKGTADVFSPKVLRATAGMIFHIPLVYVDDIAKLKELIDKLGKRICVTVPVGGRPYYERELSRGIALVIGNEGNGITEELIELADERLTIPMRGEIESLNAAISAAILMYEAVRE